MGVAYAVIKWESWDPSNSPLDGELRAASREFQ